MAFLFAVAVGLFRSSAVDYQRQFLQALLLVDVVNEFEVVEFGVVGATYIDGGISDAVECECIANKTNRSGVNDNVVVSLTEFFEEVVYLIRDKQLGRVGRYRTCADYIEAIYFAYWSDNLVEIDVRR